MRAKKILSAVQAIALPAAVAVLIAVFLLLARGRVQTDFPVLHPEDGVLDARGVGFSDDVYHLVNSWDYYPGHLYTPADFSDPAAAPQKDNDAPLNPTLGTWRLRLLADPNLYLSLCSFSVDYGTRVFVNGAEVRNIGFVSDDPERATAMVRYITLPLYTGESGEVEIIYQYSNYVHNDGGFIQHTLLSVPENIDEYQRGLTLYSLLISSGLLFLMFYFLLCASIQRRWEYAALALCCFVIAFRNQLFFAEYLLGSHYAFNTEYRLIVLDVSLIPASALFLLASFFPNAIKKRDGLLLLGMFSILSVLHFVVPTQGLVLLCHICYYVCAPALLWFVYRLIRYFRTDHAPNRDDILTLSAITLLTVVLVYEGVNSGSNAGINHFGITPLAFTITILILAIVLNGRVQKQALLLRQVHERNELLRQVNEMNKEFLRTVAHELKTPLTVISGYAQLIGRQMEKDQLSEQTPDRLKTIRQEADRLGEIVTRLMDYTYGDAKEAALAAVDIGSLFESTAAVMTPVCRKRENRLLLHNSCKTMIRGNFELLLQVLINLIVNASRHTEQGTITVESAEADGFAVFTVTDTGSGIAPEDVPHIFEKGYTTDEGQGLGLAICMETVQMHGGTLELVSTGPDGSSFRFTIPKEHDL